MSSEIILCKVELEVVYFVPTYCSKTTVASRLRQWVVKSLAQDFPGLNNLCHNSSWRFVSCSKTFLLETRVLYFYWFKH